MPAWLHVYRDVRDIGTAEGLYLKTEARGYVL